MSKITFKNKKGKITIINRLSYPETVNERVYNAIASGMFDGFLPVTIRQKRKETQIECVVQGLIPLTQYFNGLVTRKMFLDFVHEIALQIKNCEKNMINTNNLDLQSDKIFIDPQTKSVRCIFWPVVNNQRGTSPHFFLRQLPLELNFNPHEDREYLQTYQTFFTGISPFSVNNFDRMVLKLSGRKDSSGRATPSETLTGALSREVHIEKKKVTPSEKASIEYDPLSDVLVVERKAEHRHDNAIKTTQEGWYDSVLFCTSCGKENQAGANFCARCGTKLGKEETARSTNPTVDFETMVLGDDSGGTTVLGFDEPEKPVFPTLLRKRTEEFCCVDKPTFRIGTEQSYCDLFICDNNYISRSHADIITREDRYYIIDRNSTNKTFVDGKVIPVEKEVEIFPGTQIRLADEDFIFNMES